MVSGDIELCLLTPQPSDGLLRRGSCDGSTSCSLLGLLGPDGQLVSGRVGEVEAAPAGERVDRLEDLPARGLDRLYAALEILGVHDHERAAGPDLRVAPQAAHLLAVALDPRVVGP